MSIGVLLMPDTRTRVSATIRNVPFPLQSISMVVEKTVGHLNERFAIAGLAEVIEGIGGLPKISIHPNTCSGEMYLHGAQVTSWKPAASGEVIFLSARAQFEDGKAIRGGVPVCFPWFAKKKDDPDAPMHGMVRLREWQLDSISQKDGSVTVTMSTASDAFTKHWWAGEFVLRHVVTFGQKLTMQLEVTNTGAAPFRIEEALHAYLKVGDVRRVEVLGLDGVHYIDKADERTDKVQDGAVTVSSETDRVYLDTRSDLTLRDPVLDREITLHKQNSSTTVVWNPWSEKAKALTDLGDHEWPGMIAIEASNVLDFAVELAPGEQKVMAVTLGI